MRGKKFGAIGWPGGSAIQCDITHPYSSLLSTITSIVKKVTDWDHTMVIGS